MEARPGERSRLLARPECAGCFKAPDEYRIAILGDSFCASTTSDNTWPALSRKIANQDEPLKHPVGKSVIMLLSFALGGTGSAQCPDSHKYKSAKFNPNLAIVNFVSSHIFPLYAYRDAFRVGEGDCAMFNCSTLPVDIGNNNRSNGTSFVFDPAQPDYALPAARIVGEANEPSSFVRHFTVLRMPKRRRTQCIVENS